MGESILTIDVYLLYCQAQWEALVFICKSFRPQNRVCLLSSSMKQKNVHLDNRYKYIYHMLILSHTL